MCACEQPDAMPKSVTSMHVRERCITGHLSETELKRVPAKSLNSTVSHVCFDESVHGHTEGAPKTLDVGLPELQSSMKPLQSRKIAQAHPCKPLGRALGARKHAVLGGVLVVAGVSGTSHVPAAHLLQVLRTSMPIRAYCRHAEPHMEDQLSHSHQKGASSAKGRVAAGSEPASLPRFQPLSPVMNS